MTYLQFYCHRQKMRPVYVFQSKNPVQNVDKNDLKKNSKHKHSLHVTAISYAVFSIIRLIIRFILKVKFIFC